MQRHIKLRTPLLAVVLSVLAEVLFFGVVFLASVTSPRDNPVLAWEFFGWFHSLPECLTMSFMAAFKPFQDIRSIQAQVTVTLMIVLIALLQWYVLFLVGISLFRRFGRKAAA